MNLIEALEGHQQDSVLVVGPKGQRTAGHLLEIARTCDTKLAGAKLAVQLDDPIEGISTLVAACGVAESLALLPISLSEPDTSTLLSRSGSDVFLTGGQGQRGVVGAVHVSSTLHALPDRLGATEGPSVDTTWFLATSGTTNTPKLVAHTLESLCRTVRTGDSALSARWGLLYDFSRFAGLQVVLQSLVGGSTLIIPDQQGSLRERLEFLHEYGCTHLSATPTLWRAIVMTPGGRELPLRQITLGGEIADARILATLRSMFPKARITHIYASTEAGVGFSVKDGKPGFPSSYLEHPPSGLALRIFEERLHIRNAHDMQSFYVGTTDHFGTADGWIDTGDSVEMVADRVYFRGRANGAINVGGNKVHPEEVEQVLLGHPAIQAARVFGKSSSIMGNLVAAEIVPTEQSGDTGTLRSDVKAYLQNKLEGHKVPAVLKIVEKLDMTSTGKLARVALAE